MGGRGIWRRYLLGKPGGIKSHTQYVFNIIDNPFGLDKMLGGALMSKAGLVISQIRAPDHSRPSQPETLTPEERAVWDNFEGPRIRKRHQAPGELENLEELETPSPQAHDHAAIHVPSQIVRARRDRAGRFQRLVGRWTMISPSPMPLACRAMSISAKWPCIFTRTTTRCENSPRRRRNETGHHAPLSASTFTLSRNRSRSSSRMLIFPLRPLRPIRRQGTRPC